MMATTDNNSKIPVISKKWLYGSLAVIALILGLFLDNSTLAAEDNSALNAVEQVEIDNEDGEVEIDTSMENDDFDSADFKDDYDDFVEDDRED